MLKFVFNALLLLQVGRKIQVLITRIDEDKNDLILSEREAWVGSSCVYIFLYCLLSSVSSFGDSKLSLKGALK